VAIFVTGKGVLKVEQMRRRIIVAFLLLCAHFEAFSSHIQGGNITYTCVGPNTYNITLTVMTDCFGATPPSVLTDLFFFPSCGIPFSAAAGLQSITEISDVCASELPGTSCNNGFAPGTNLVVYTINNIVLPLACNYNIVWASADWNDFTNVNNVVPCPQCFATAYFTTTINNAAPCNNSVQVINTTAEPLVPNACLGTAVTYLPQISNPNGYTLSFSLVNVQMAGGVSVNYEAGFSGASPIPGITINPVTGAINFFAGQIGNFVVGIQIQQFDGGGNLIGTLNHAMTFVVRPCVVGVTTFTNPSIQSVTGAGISVNSTTAAVCQGNQMCVTVQATNNNVFRNIILSSNFEALFPGATFVQTGNNPAIGTLCLDASIPYPPSTVVTINAIDDACINPSSAQIQITINILPSLAIQNNTLNICAGDAVQLNVTGDNNYTWVSLAGPPISVPANFSCANCGNPTVSPPSTTTYQVTGNTINPACVTSGTITVNVSLSDFTSGVVDESCSSANGQLTTSPNAGFGPYTYAWTGPGAFTSNNQNISGLSAGNYSVTVTDIGLPGCSVVQNFTLNNTAPPTGALLNSNVTICAGQCVNLNFDLTGTGPFNATMTNVPNQNGINDGHIVQVCPATTTTYTLNSITDSNVPACVTAVNQSITVTVRPIPTANFISPGILCQNEAANLELNINQPGNFVLNYSVNGTAQPAVNPATDGQLIPISQTATTNYTVTSVQYPTEPACPNVVVASTTVDVYPTIVLNNATTICDPTNEFFQVVFNISGGTSGTYVVAENGTAGGTLGPGPLFQFSSVFVPNGTNVSFDVTGIENCDPVSFSVNNYSCPVVTDAGTMSPVPLFLCQNQVVCGNWNNNPTLDGNDQVMFVLHDSPGPGLGNIIATDCNDICFNDADTPLVFGNGVGQVQIGTTYYISAVAGNDDGSGDCVNLNHPDISVAIGQPVTFQEVPTASISGGGTICQGDVVNVTIDFVGTPPFTVSYDINAAPGGVNLVSNTNQLVISTGQAGTYTISALSNAICPGTDSGSAVVTLNPQFSVDVLDNLCDPTNEFFNVYMEIGGGIPGTIAVAETGTAGGNTVQGNPTIFTSALIANGTNVSFTISDAGVCPDQVINVNNFSCPVITDAGTMSPVPLFLCQNQVVCGNWNNNPTLDGNDQVMFVLHDSPGPGLGNIIATDCNDICFNDADTPLVFGNGVGQVQIGTTYYISAVAGNDDGSGDCVNLNHPDISVAIGQPVTFQEVATANISGGGTICQGETVDVIIDFVGMPPFTVSYQINGVNEGVNLVVNTNQLIIPADQAGNYTISAMTNGPCPGVFAGNAVVNVNPLPSVTDFSGASSLCDGQTFDLIFNLSGTAPWTIELEFDNGVDPVSVSSLAVAASPFVQSIGDNGTYTVSLISDALCDNTSIPSVYDLTVFDLPTATITSADTLVCPGGEANFVAALTGTGPFTVIYAIDNVNQAPVIVAGNTLSFSTSIDGVYTITSISDANCQNTGTGSMSLSTLPPPAADAGPDQNLCSQVDLLLGTPNDPAFTYTWTGAVVHLDDTGIPQPTLNAPNTTGADIALNFQLTVFNGACEAVDDVVINIQPEPIADAGVDAFICFEDNVQLAASGGVSCTWAASPSLDDDQICNPTASPLADEVFTVTVEGANGCLATDDVLISVNPELTLGVITTDLVSCFQLCDGGGEFDAAGGAGNYTFDWVDTNQTVVSSGASVNDVCPGDYTVVLTDDAGCTDQLPFTITENPELLITAVDVVNPSCFGFLDGEILITSADAIEFSLNGGVPQANGDFQGLTSGDYDILVQDVFGCQATDQVTLTSPDEITISVLTDNIIYCHQQPIPLQATAIGGVGGFTYFWQDENGVALGTGEPFNYIANGAQTVDVFAEDANGCPSPILSVTLEPNEPFSLTFLSDSVFVICNGETINLSVLTSGGLGFQDVEWVDAITGVVLSNSAQFDVQPTLSTVYFVNVTDGCTEPLQALVDITVNPVPAVILTADSISGCFPVNVQFTNGTDPALSDQCVWDFGDGGTLDGCVPGIIYTYENPGTFAPSLTVTSSEGCTGSAALNVPVVIHDYPNPDFSWQPNPNSLIQETQFFNQTPGINQYLWTVDGDPMSSVANPTYTFVGPDLFSYEICLSATNQFGCERSTCKILTIEPLMLIYVPNAFTPDADNLNEYFKPIVKGISNQDYSFRIYNRWGEKIFETSDPEMAWTGNNENGEFFVEPGVYVWRLLVKDLINGDTHEFSGHVTIVR